MNKLIWKELRENSLWAGLMALVFALAGLFLLHQQGALASWFPLSEQHQQASSPYQVYNTYRLWIIFGAPVIGAMLGFLQIVPEMRRDNWALLIHRPAPLRSIFLAKVIVGLGLFLLTVGFPFALATIALCAPGNFPGPFAARLAAPELLWILTGVVYYFAAILVAIRPARWWGSRLLPLVTALLCTTACGIAEYAWQLIVAIVAFAAILAIAALGSFETRGEYRGQSRLQRFGLGLAMYVGAAAVAVVLGTLGYTWLNRGNTNAGGYGFGYALTTEGQLVQTVFPANGQEYAVDLNGRRLLDKEISHLLSFDISLSDRRPLGFGYSGIFGSYDSYYWFFGSVERFAYYYDYQSRVIDIVDAKRQRVIGYTGAHGRSDVSPSEAGPFPDRSIRPIDYNNFGTPKIRLLLPNGIYDLDEVQGTTSLFAAPPPGSHFTSADYPAAQPYGTSHDYLIAVTDKGILQCYRLDGRLLFSIPPGQTATPYSDIAAYELNNPQRFGFIYLPSTANRERPTVMAPWRQVTVLPTGRIMANDALPRAKLDFNGSPTPNKPLFLCFPVAVAACVDIVFRIDAAIQTAQGQFAVVDPGPLPVAQGGYMLLGGLISAVIVLLLARRYAWNRRETIIWTVAMLFLSWPGLLMIFATIPFPTRVVCPKCGRKRAVTHDLCEHCAAPFPPPAPDGREIFEPAAEYHWQESVLTS